MRSRRSLAVTLMIIDVVLAVVCLAAGVGIILERQGDRYRATSTTTLLNPVAGTESTFVYFASCDDARAAGAAPLSEGDPGFRVALDRDGDGVACDD